MNNKLTAVNAISSWLDRLLALVIILIVSPLWLGNILLAVVRSNRILIELPFCDALGRWRFARQFSQGLFRDSFLLILVASGEMRFIGLSRFHGLQASYGSSCYQEFQGLPSGVFSLYDLYQWVGLIEASHQDALRQQHKRAGSVAGYYMMLLQIVAGWIAFGCVRMKDAGVIELFDINIHNDTLADALRWFAKNPGEQCRSVFFVNAHSINIAQTNSSFKARLQSADKVFADGSGVRLAAMRCGYRLRSNLNGTDLVPALCQQLAASGGSVFLLGGEAGIAVAAADHLKRAYPALRIAGTHHGYLDSLDSDLIVQKINRSGASVLLVGLGSPLQEEWILAQAPKLECAFALAVGGLFDFLSGKFSRAPLWLRAVGMEWVWRLFQDPVTKFSRYVVGNPLFIYRLVFQLEAGK